MIEIYHLGTRTPPSSLMIFEHQRNRPAAAMTVFRHIVKCNSDTCARRRFYYNCFAVVPKTNAVLTCMRIAGVHYFPVFGSGKKINR